jgi:hypothetical protein
MLKPVHTILAAAAAGAASAALVSGVLSASPAGTSVPSYRVVEKTVSVPQKRQLTTDLQCPSGMVPVGGGWRKGGSWSPVGHAGGGDIDPSHSGWEYTLNVDRFIQGGGAYVIDVVCIAP